VIALGVVLILLVVLVTIFAVVASGTISSGIALTGLGITVSARPLSLFIAGALSMVLLGVGVSLVSNGTRRKAGKRKELKTLRKEHAAPATRTTDDRGGNRTHDKSSRAAETDAERPRRQAHQRRQSRQRQSSRQGHRALGSTVRTTRGVGPPHPGVSSAMVQPLTSLLRSSFPEVLTGQKR